MVEIRNELVTTRVKVKSKVISSKPFGKYKWFIDTRNSPLSDNSEHRKKDVRKFGKCISCGKAFEDDDDIFMAFSVVKNGKNIGNRFVDIECSKKYGNWPNN